MTDENRHEKPLGCAGKRAWIIADMDSTLVERPPSGLFPTLEESPCLKPVLEWLRLGGGLCVVTTAARRSITQVWDCVPAELRAQRAVILSALEGGDLVYGDELGNMATDHAYQSRGASGGQPTCFDSGTLDTLMGYAISMVHAIFTDMLEDSSILSALSTKYHVPVAAVLKRLAEGERMEDLLSRERLMEPGAIMSTTGERFISFNRPLLDTTGERVCTISIMGFPGAFSKRYYQQFVEKAAAVGADLSAAPNSLWFTPSGVSKASPIHWLQSHAEDYCFDLGNAVAFGDCPHTNDGPLTTIPLSAGDGPPVYCPFVSVAHTDNVPKIPAHTHKLHVGGLEYGTAKVVEALLSSLRGDPQPATGQHFVPTFLEEAVQQCQKAAETCSAEAVDGREV